MKRGYKSIADRFDNSPRFRESQEENNKTRDEMVALDELFRNISLARGQPIQEMPWWEREERYGHYHRPQHKSGGAQTVKNPWTYTEREWQDYWKEHQHSSQGSSASASDWKEGWQSGKWRY